MTGRGYLLGSQSERERLAGIEAALDPGTRRHLEALGLGPGAGVLEVGAGGGSVARWLGERVLPGGRVVAADVDTHLLEPLAAHGIEVRRHDIVDDPLEQDSFDFVHARYLLEHLPERGAALDKLVAALRPGGWLLVEAGDSAVAWLRAHESPAVDRLLAAFEAVFEAAGFDSFYGRRLPTELARRGLVDVGGEGRTNLVPSLRSPAGRSYVLSVEQVRGQMLAAGLIGEEELEQAVDEWLRADEPFFAHLTVAVWGRRP